MATNGKKKPAAKKKGKALSKAEVKKRADIQEGHRLKRQRKFSRGASATGAKRKAGYDSGGAVYVKKEKSVKAKGLKAKGAVKPKAKAKVMTTKKKKK